MREYLLEESGSALQRKASRINEVEIGQIWQKTHTNVFPTFSCYNENDIKKVKKILLKFKNGFKGTDALLVSLQKGHL